MSSPLGERGERGEGGRGKGEGETGVGDGCGGTTWGITNQQPTTNNQPPTTNNQQPTTNNQQPTTNPSGSPVAWVGKPYQGRPFTTNQQPTTPEGFTSRLGRETLPRAPLHQLPTTNNQQPRRGSPVAWVGKPYQGRPFTNNQLTND
ncbi:MAG: hypothetical protein ACHBN1_21975 [Heteroscytonema crispum UTEX LB 1556]